MKKLIKSIIYCLKKKNKIPVFTTVDKELLKDRIALITGGSGGIGFGIAKKYIASGCKVIIAGTNEEKLIKCSNMLGENCKYIVIDLYDSSTFDDKIDEAVKMFGKIDILVNCAGVHISRMGLDFLNSTEEEYDKVMNLNLKATYFFSQSFAKYMIENKIKGNILMISSQSALEPAWSPYRLSKWGIKGFTSGLAQKMLKYDIVVNGIAPGPTATGMQNWTDGETIWTEQNPIERFTLPEEIAEYAVLLVSPLGNTIIGDTIYMSGGRGIIELR